MADEQQSVLKVLVELVDQITEPLHKINESFEEFSNSARGWWTAAAEIFAGYETIEGLVEPAAAMQEHMADLALATHAGTEELVRFKEQAEELATVFPVKGGAEEIADTMAELYKTFGDSGSLKEQTEIAARLAVVMKGDAATAAMILASGVQNLGDASKPVTEQMQLLGDRLAVLRDRFPAGSTGLQRMAMDLRMLGTVQKTYNVGQIEMISLLAEANRLHLGGIRGAGPILQQIVEGLLKVGKDGQTEMARYGLQVVKTNDGHVNLIATLEKLKEKGPAAVREFTRHLPAQAQAIGLVINHLDDWKKAYGEVDNAGGELAKSSDAHTKTFDQQMQLLENSFKNLKDTIASSGLLENLTKLVKGMTHFVQIADHFLSAHPRVAHALGGLITGFAALLSIAGIVKFGQITVGLVKLAGVLIRLPVILEMLGNAWAAMSLIATEGIGSVGAALGLMIESNPIGWIITALAAVAFVGYEVWKNWDKIKDTIHEVVESAKWAVDSMRSWGIGDWGHFVGDVITGNPYGAITDIATQGHPASINSQSSSAPHFTYNPSVTVNVAPGTDAAAAAQLFHQVLRSHSDDFEDWLKEHGRDNERRSFRGRLEPSGGGGY